MSLDDYSFAVENFSNILEELYPLWREHHNELVGKNIPLQPDLNKYLMLEQKKYLVIFTIRDKNNRLIGYSFFILGTHIHRTQVVKADNDLFFITARHRKGWLASRFIKYCDKKLLTSFVTQVQMRTKVKQSFGILLERCGYAHEEVVYIKKKE